MPRNFLTVHQFSFQLFVYPSQLGGSICKGVTEALPEKSSTEDNKQCQIWGKPFSGIEPLMDKPIGRVKMLMVHRVGDHIPGYSSEFMEKLAKELGLISRLGLYKNITLISPANPEQKLGSITCNTTAK